MAVFWMNPDAGPAGTAVVAQLTVVGTLSATMGAHGRSTVPTGSTYCVEDWKAVGITFSN